MNLSRPSSQLISIQPRTISICSSEIRSSNSSARAIASIAYRSTEPLHPAVGLPDLTGPGDCAQPRRSSQPFKHLWRALVRQLTRLEDSLIGDALGVLFLFASLWGFLWLAPVVEELLK